ncbi:MAG: STAS-like domain-containing protein [Bacteroidales bacterium]|jgi:UDP-N-acetyl-D-mannosaminuronic acid transferase (WecB/TagA/CpsF family)|nr:STAS-like domain-containing protein [Bacteroidales bacterium]
MNQSSILIQVANVIGNYYAVEATEGQKVYELIKKAITENQKIMLSFLNIEMMTTAFLNTAIGQLYNDFSEEQIKDSLTLDNMSDSGKVILKRVVDTAKLYYKDPDTFQRMQESINEILKQH